MLRSADEFEVPLIQVDLDGRVARSGQTVPDVDLVGIVSGVAHNLFYGEPCDAGGIRLRFLEGESGVFLRLFLRVGIRVGDHRGLFVSIIIGSLSFSLTNAFPDEQAMREVGLALAVAPPLRFLGGERLVANGQANLP